MNLEGMTGEEVAIEEARVAARKENRRVVTEGLKETRKLLRTPEEPLASRRQKTAQGVGTLGAVPRPPRDAGWEQRAREQGFDTGRVLYHSTSEFDFGGKEFERFIPSAIGKLGPGVYTSSEPDYTQRYISGGINADGARTIPVFARGRIAGEP